MPLIIVTGLPASGKSTRAKQLYQYLLKRVSDPRRLHIVSDDLLSISRSVYDLSDPEIPNYTRSSNASEKNARAALYAAVKRLLSDKDFVILDSLNYIKGWRYQLHCEAKAVRTASCVLQIGCSRRQAKQVNEERLRRRHGDDDKTAKEQENDDDSCHVEPYEPGNFENLVYRYEEPNPMTRWESPLFTLVWDDDVEQTNNTFDALWEAIAGQGRRIVRPNQATVQRGRDANGNYLYLLDHETQDIVKRILEYQQRDEFPGRFVRIPLDNVEQGHAIVTLPVGRKLSLPQLQRLRRAYIGLNRGGIGLESVRNMAADAIRETFVIYLNDTLDNDD
ncbi:hypothetical protein CDD81_1660 [Ophiocordyceps australis]|uniref:RNA polymerase II elongator complex subunit n=1 Tax=Ophiocordyceps australis TaxID=1399860 RepID=A0A2C5XF93_9HYPO|nr:hypothetical protein CDD81_1660 [Ophiocordyceps australis]